MKNFQKIAFVMVALLSQTAFSVTSTDQRLLNAQLFNAVIAGNTTQALTLLKSGADVNARYGPDAFGGDKSGFESLMTPLMKAAEQEDVPMIQLLLQNKARILQTKVPREEMHLIGTK